MYSLHIFACNCISPCNHLKEVVTLIAAFWLSVYDNNQRMSCCDSMKTKGSNIFLYFVGWFITLWDDHILHLNLYIFLWKFNHWYFIAWKYSSKNSHMPLINIKTYNCLVRINLYTKITQCILRLVLFYKFTHISITNHIFIVNNEGGIIHFVNLSLLYFSSTRSVYIFWYKIKFLLGYLNHPHIIPA